MSFVSSSCYNGNDVESHCGNEQNKAIGSIDVNHSRVDNLQFDNCNNDNDSSSDNGSNSSDATVVIVSIKAMSVVLSDYDELGMYWIKYISPHQFVLTIFQNAAYLLKAHEERFDNFLLVMLLEAGVISTFATELCQAYALQHCANGMV